MMVFVLSLLCCGVGVDGLLRDYYLLSDIHYPGLSLIFDWPTAAILACDWPALTQSTPCRRHDCLVEWTRAT